MGGGRISAVATACGESTASAIGAIRVGRGDSRAGVNRQRSDSQSRAATVCRGAEILAARRVARQPCRWQSGYWNDIAAKMADGWRGCMPSNESKNIILNGLPSTGKAYETIKMRLLNNQRIFYAIRSDLSTGSQNV